MNQLVERGDYAIAVTDTTRLQRVNDAVPETDGTEYYFRDEEQMLQELRDGELIEAAIIHNQQVSGMRIEVLRKAQEQAQHVIADVDTHGAQRYHQLKPEANYVFVIPPDLQTWLQRMTNRGQLDQDEINRRLKSAEKEFQHALDHGFYTFVVNDELEDSVAAVNAIVNGVDGHLNQEQSRDMTWQLLNELKRKLYS
jgi:guanylate kinase